ncbi:MAG: hypothetical protein OEL83_05860 [Desulforhopalus sp.]|nr:hypothetical protein [Desulforhopalus sp.]
MKTISPLTIINRPVPVSGAQGGPAPSPVTAGSELPSFSPGQMLRAMVVAENAANQFTLEAGGSRFVVQSKNPLSPGQSLNLQVLSTEPTIELQITADATGRFLSRSLASTGGSQDLSQFFNLLQQTGSAQLPNLSSSSLNALQQFALLQQQNVPGAEAAAGQPAMTGRAPAADSGPKLLQQIFAQLGVELEGLFAAGQGQSSLTSIKTALQDLSLLFQGQGQLSPTASAQLDQLSAPARQLFEIFSFLQQNSTAGQGAKDAALNQLFQQFQLQSGSLLTADDAANALTTLKTGLAELSAFFKAPEGLLQLFSTNDLQSGLLTRAQAEAILFPQGGGVGLPTSGGEKLQQLVGKLGLNLETLLAAGNKEEAVKTVKFALMELVQNFTGRGELAESGKQALSSLEFFQLAQLQTIRQDALVVPIPLPFLDQGYLVVEDYKDQSAGDGQAREMPSHFSLLLKLAPLGNLKIDFLSSGENTYIRFYCQSKEVSDFLAGFKEELEAALTGTTVRGVSFSQSSEDPLTAVLKRSMAGADSLVNTKI